MPAQVLQFPRHVGTKQLCGCNECQAIRSHAATLGIDVNEPLTLNNMVRLMKYVFEIN